MNMKLRRAAVFIPMIGIFILVLGFQNCSPGQKFSFESRAEVESNSSFSSKLNDSEKVTLEGEITATYEDYEDGTHKLKHHLQEKSGKIYEIKTEHGLGVPSMSYVKIKGKVRKGKGSVDTLEVAAEDTTVFMYNDLPTDNSLYTYADGGTSPYSIGEQKTLLVLVNFIDNPLEEITVTEAQQWLKGLDAYVREGSKGKAWVTGQVAGWVTINQSTTVCDVYNLQNLANYQVSQSGVDTQAFSRFIYAFPKNSCGMSGSGSVGGKTTTSYIVGNLRRNGTLFHEFGHNLGLGHSYSYACDTGILGPHCNTYQYGDTLDVLGRADPGDTGSYTPRGKMYLGWLDSHEVINVTAAGVYNIIPNADNSSGQAKVLRIAKPGDSGYWLDVNLYQPIGFDEIMLNNFFNKYGSAPSENIKNGIVVRESTKYWSALLDLTPQSVSCCYDRYDVALAVGKSFQDPYSGIKLTTESVSPMLGAAVRVEFTDQKTCRPRIPSITYPEGQYTSSPNASGMPGVPTEVTATIVTPSSLDCGNESVTVRAELPEGWIVDLGPMPLSIPAGSQTTFKFTITPPADAALGTYYPYFWTSSERGSNYSTSSSRTNLKFQVVSTPPTNKPPVAVNDAVTITTKVAVKVSVLANDYDPEGKPLSIVSVGRPGYGSAAINSDGTITYTPSSRFKSSDSFTYSISDGSLSRSATVSITLSGGSTDSGSKGKGGSR